MSKKCILILELLFYLLAFISCGTNKESVYQYRPPTKEEEIIDEHLVNNNIEALIEDCIKYPDYNNQISNYLLYDIDYSNTEYSQLLQYQRLANNDSILFNGYEFLITQKEEQILSVVAEMSLEEIGRYYKNNVSEQSFLRPVLCSAFVRIIDTLQYSEIKTIYNIFSSTDIIAVH